MGDKKIVVVQLSGGNDYLNTVIPYDNPLYRDARQAVGIPDNEILKLDKGLGFHPRMGVVQDLFQQGNVAVVWEGRSWSLEVTMPSLLPLMPT